MGLHPFLNFPSESTLSADIFVKTNAQRKREALNRVKPEPLALACAVSTQWDGHRVFSKGAEILMLAANNYLGLSGIRV